MGRREDIEAELALQDRAVERHERKIAKAIKDAMLQVATELRATLNPDLPFDHFRRIEEAMGDLYRDVTRSMAASMIDRFKAGFEYLETKDDNEGFYERIWQEYLNQYGGTRIAQISETTRRQIVALIDKGLRDGLSLDEIAGEIRMRAPDMSALRAHTIARTETHSASMYASLQSAKQSTVELLKEWVSVEDSRTRDFGEGDGVVDFYDHRGMNGVKVPIDDPFEVPNKLGGSEKLMFPGDPAGSAANIINCRCAQVYVDTDEDEIEDDDVDVEVIAAPAAVASGAFLYRTVKDPPAKAQAVSDFLESYGVADKVPLKGVPIKPMAKNARYFLEVKERFDLDPLVGVGNVNYWGIKRPRNSQALASMYGARDPYNGHKGIFDTPKGFGDPKEASRLYLIHQHEWTREKYAKLQKEQLKRPQTETSVHMRVETMSKKGHRYGWTVDGDADSADNMLRSTIYHEFGHYVHLHNTRHPQMGADIQQVIDNAKPRQNGWGALVSHYGTYGSKNITQHRDKEYVAEAFALYMEGDHMHYRIHPDLLRVFQRYDLTSPIKSEQMQEIKAVNTKELVALTDPNDGGALIAAVLNAREEDRDRVAEELLAAYTDRDKPLVEAWLGEALAQLVTGTI